MKILRGGLRKFLDIRKGGSENCWARKGALKICNVVSVIITLLFIPKIRNAQTFHNKTTLIQ